MRTEPCENCGTPVMVAAEGLDPDGPRVLWHQLGFVGSQGTAWVQHTPRVCQNLRRARP